ncbi:MAG TPA: DUF4215 domain-containing protein, partial [Nannocystis sp.]
MTRILFLTASLVLVPACFVQEIEDIIANHTSATMGSTGGTSTGGTSTSGTSTGRPGTGTGTGGEADTLGDTHDPSSGGLGGTGTGTTQADTAAESSTGTAPLCGDGLIEGDEECDDANTVDADGCLNNCTREWLVFVTSDPGTQGHFGGVIGADYECRHRATKLFLPNGERYKAWISTSLVQPVDRLYHARGPYKLVNGLRVAANWDALVSGSLENPINVTELGHTSEGAVFTGTLPDGTRAPDSTHCDGWTDNDGDNFGWYGA